VLDVSAESTLRQMPSKDVLRLIKANSLAKAPPRKLRATVHLGNGTTATASLPIETLKDVFRDVRPPDQTGGCSRLVRPSGDFTASCPRDPGEVRCIRSHVDDIGRSRLKSQPERTGATAIVAVVRVDTAQLCDTRRPR